MSERHYPQAFKFAIVVLLAFDVIIFFDSSNLIVKLYCTIMFIAILNGWAAAEDDSIDYGDLYLLNDAICSAMYFMILLELNKGTYANFWFYSCVIFLMYTLWNIMLVKQKQVEEEKLHKYIVCDIVACLYSVFAFLIVMLFPFNNFAYYVQYIGMTLWIFLLLKWYYDFYIRSFRQNNKEIKKLHKISKN